MTSLDEGVNEATPRARRGRSVAAVLVGVIMAGVVTAVLMARPTSGGPLAVGNAGVVVDGFEAGSVVTYGLQTLGHAGTGDPIVLESVQVRVGDPSLEVLGEPMLLGPERVAELGSGTFDVLAGWPPGQAPDPLPVSGAVIPPGEASRFEVVIPVRVPERGVGVVEGFTITYEAGGRRYREHTEMTLVLCPVQDRQACQGFDPMEGLGSLRH